MSKEPIVKTQVVETPVVSQTKASTAPIVDQTNISTQLEILEGMVDIEQALSLILKSLIGDMLTSTNLDERVKKTKVLIETLRGNQV